MANKLLTVFDFTIPKSDEVKHEDTVKIFLKGFSKKWTFQEETGKTGYKHYQGRISLKIRARLSTVINKFRVHGIHWGVTSGENKTNNFYVTKEETRVNGPWSDVDEENEIYIPRQFRDKLNNLRPFQQYIWRNKNEFDDRKINMIYCDKGNKGKTVIACLTELFSSGVSLPIVNDAEKLIQSAENICRARCLRNPSPFFIDLPRAMEKNRLNGIYTAIEVIKSGKLYDVRYKYRTWWIDSPVIWVFSNVHPNMRLLSTDRWKIWTINEQYQLVELDKKSIRNIENAVDHFEWDLDQV